MKRENSAARAEATIVAQVLDVFEEARVAKRLRVVDIAHRAHLSKRMVGLVRKLQARPSVRTLIALADAHGLELDIRVRTKRPRVEHPQIEGDPRIVSAEQSISHQSAVENNAVR